MKYIVGFDVETTGLNIFKDDIIEIGAEKRSVVDWKPFEFFQEFLRINNFENLSSKTTKLTGIKSEHLAQGMSPKIVLENFINTLLDNDSVLLAYNASFDMAMLQNNCKRLNIELPPVRIYDMLELAKMSLGSLKNLKLTTLADHYGIDTKRAHRAYNDTHTMLEVMQKMCGDLGVSVGETLQFLRPIDNHKVFWLQEYNNISYIKYME